METVESSPTGVLSEECGQPQHPEHLEDGEPTIKAGITAPADIAAPAAISAPAECAKNAASVQTAESVEKAASAREAQCVSTANHPHTAGPPYGGEWSSLDEQSLHAERSPDAWLPRDGKGSEMNVPFDHQIGEHRELAAAGDTLDIAAIQRIVKSALS
jgi:hypothetical protein